MKKRLALLQITQLSQLYALILVFFTLDFCQDRALGCLFKLCFDNLFKHLLSPYFLKSAEILTKQNCRNDEDKPQLNRCLNALNRLKNACLTFSNFALSSRLAGNNNAYRVLFTNNQYVMSGGNNKIWTFPNALTWTECHSGTGFNLYDLTYERVYSGSQINRNTYYFCDAITWTSQLTGVSDFFLGVAYGNDRFAVLRYFGPIFASQRFIASYLRNMRRFRPTSAGFLVRAKSLS